MAKKRATTSAETGSAPKRASTTAKRSSTAKSSATKSTATKKSTAATKSTAKSTATAKPSDTAAAEAGGSSRKTTTAAKAAGAKAAGTKAAGTKAAGTKAAGTKAAGTKAAGAKAAGTKAAGTKAAGTSRPAGTPAGATGPRKAAKRQFTGIRAVLTRRQLELREEYDSAMVELDALQRDRVGDTAGDDQADAGTKTFEREQEISLTNSIVDRLGQVGRALERIDEGTYGFCERCGKHIPKARLEAFPSVTLCIACKQHEERR